MMNALSQTLPLRLRFDIPVPIECKLNSHKLGLRLKSVDICVRYVGDVGVGGLDNMIWVEYRLHV